MISAIDTLAISTIMADISYGRDEMTSQVANTILQQLGASRFLAMTGARNLVAGEDTLQFDLPRNSMAPTQPAMNGVYAEDLASTFSRVTGLDVSL
jgi:hypothetical protein